MLDDAGLPQVRAGPPKVWGARPCLGICGIAGEFNFSVFLNVESLSWKQKGKSPLTSAAGVSGFPCTRACPRRISLTSKPPRHVSMNLSGIVFPPQIAAYISGALMQLCHLDCLAGEREGKKKKSTKQNFVYQENKARKIACDTHEHKDSEASPESGRNKSRQFLLTITRQNTEALYLLKCKFIQGSMLPCCKYQTPLKTREQE